MLKFIIKWVLSLILILVIFTLLVFVMSVFIPQNVETALRLFKIVQ